MLNLGLDKKDFIMGTLNVQGIQNKIEQIDFLLNSSGNDILFFYLVRANEMSVTLLAFLISKTFNLFVKIVISADRPEHGRGRIDNVKNEIKCERRLQNVDLENARTLV